MQLGEYLDNIEKKLVRSFDITRGYSLDGINYDMFAEFHLRNEKYVLSKKAVLYAIESNEYCLLKSFDRIDRSTVTSFADGIIRSLETIVKPDTNHMCSMVNGVMILDGGQETGLEDAIGEVKRFKYHRSFSFGFKGWSDIRLLIVSLKGGVIAANKQGKGISKVYDF